MYKNTQLTEGTGVAGWALKNWILLNEVDSISGVFSTGYLVLVYLLSYIKVHLTSARPFGCVRLTLKSLPYVNCGVQSMYSRWCPSLGQHRCPTVPWLLWRQGRRCSILNWWCITAVLHNIIVWCPFHLCWTSHHWRSGRCIPSATWQKLRYWSTTDSNTLVRHRCSHAFFWQNYLIFHWQSAASQLFSRRRTSHLAWNVYVDSSDVRSYRPISNLSVLSKLFERLVARQLLAHLHSNGLLPLFQLVYQAHHSTETAVLRILTDILLAVDAGDLSALVLLAAFAEWIRSNRLQLIASNWDPLVSYKSSTSPTATSSALSRYWLCDVVRCSPRHWNSSQLWDVDEFPCQEDSVNMFRCVEAASFHSQFSSDQSVVMSLVLSCLDYGNATQAGIHQHLRRLQSVMNAAARLIYSSSRFDHITPLLRQLHLVEGKGMI